MSFVGGFVSLSEEYCDDCTDGMNFIGLMSLFALAVIARPITVILW
ncbi:MAG: hypothetical protein KDI75_02095 [Xanthomonadales bacterium]|nr:hypothetical protein [Xanthomonadales bacterium]